MTPPLVSWSEGGPRARDSDPQRHLTPFPAPFAPAPAPFIVPLSGQAGKSAKPDESNAFLDEALKCAICHDLCDRPVTVSAALRLRLSPGVPRRKLLPVDTLPNVPNAFFPPCCRLCP